MKEILKSGFLLGLFSLILLTSLCQPLAGAQVTGREITILFTHDLHDNLLPVRDKGDSGIVQLGGYARLQTAIQAEKEKVPEALLVDGGDYSMGTPFQTIFPSDSPGLRILGQMGYDVVTFGNHEYDYRAMGLAESLLAAKKSGDQLPRIVQANVNFPTDENGNLSTSLKTLKQAYAEYGVQDYIVIQKKGVKIGIFGLMGQDAAAKAPMSEVQFADPVESAKQIVTVLKEQEKVDLIVCLSHTGLSEDQDKAEDVMLARKVPDINVIISGHSHTKLPEALVIGKTIIGSAEDSGKYLGVLKIRQEPASGWKLAGYRLQQINDSWAEDPVISAKIEEYKQEVDKKYFSKFNLGFDQVLAEAPFSFHTLDEIYAKHTEEPLGNLIGDAYIYAVEKAEGADYIPVDVAIVPAGTIRSSFFQGNITAADVFSVSSLGIGPDKIPGYPLISVYLTGKELKTASEVDASVAPLMKDAQLFMAGLKYTFNPNRLIFNKVTADCLQKPDGSWVEIDDEKLYRVVAGLYSAQMLSVVGDKSFGLLSLVPKTQDGTPITDFEAQIIRDTAGGTNQELKEWQAIAQYLQSFAKINGIPRIPSGYKETLGRKIVDDNSNIFALISKPNYISLTLYAVVIILLALAAFIIIRIAARKNRLMRPKVRDYRS